MEVCVWGLCAWGDAVWCLKSVWKKSPTAGEQGDRWERERGRCQARVIRAQRVSYWMTMGDAGRGGEGGVCAGAWVTDRSPRRELGSQHAAGVAGRQAAVIRIISRTAASSSAHRQILIGKISWDELKESCALSNSSVISCTLGQLPGKFTVWSRWRVLQHVSIMYYKPDLRHRHRHELTQVWK